MSGIRLDRTLVLEAPARVSDGAGGFGLNWTPLGTLWAEVVAGTGRETAGEEFLRASVPYRITVRAAPVGAPARPRPEQRFRDGTRIFTILAVAERDTLGKYLTCFSREEVPA